MPPNTNYNLSSSFPETYKASPLQRTLTPPAPDDGPEPFPTIESSSDGHHSSLYASQKHPQSYHIPSSSLESNISGRNFHMPPSGLSTTDTSPSLQQQVQIYCAGCRKPSILKDSYACDQCISGFCGDCVYALSSEAHKGRPCPRCRAIGGAYKPFQLDFR
jgi:hypothetical protein